MTKYDDRNRGVLFKGDKSRSEAIMTGNFKDETGKEYWLNVWPKKISEKSGKEYWPVSVKQKDGQRAASGTERTAARPSQPVKQSLADEMDDNIPFAPEFR